MFLATHSYSTLPNANSKTQGRVTVKAGVDPHLDELRERNAQLPAVLIGVAAELRKEPPFRNTGP